MNAKYIISTFVFLGFVFASGGFSSVSEINLEGIDGALIPRLSSIPAQVTGCNSAILNDWQGKGVDPICGTLCQLDVY